MPKRFDQKTCDYAVEEWPKALAKDAAAYEKQYHAPKIGTDDIVILHCKSFTPALD